MKEIGLIQRTKCRTAKETSKISLKEGNDEPNSVLFLDLSRSI